MSNQSRIEFEAWASENGMAMHLARSESGVYVSRVTQNYMDCWVASRAGQAEEIEALRKAMCQIMTQVDGNIRETVRDCVNGHDDVQDIYEYCDDIESLVDAVLSKEADV